MNIEDKNYIINAFKKEYPNIDIEKVYSRLNKASDDEIYRLANAIDRFGVKDILEAVGDKA